MIIDKKIITLDTLEKHTTNIMDEVKIYIDEKSARVKSSLETQVGNVDTNLTTEISDRKVANQQLNGAIEAEKVRAIEVENALQANISKEVTDRANAQAKEVQDRTAAIDVAKTELRAELSTASANIQKDFIIRDGEVTSAFKLGDAALNDKIENEIAERKNAVAELNGALLAEAARREVGDKLVNDLLQEHLVSASAVGSQLTSHLAAINPHELTPAIIGAADLSTQIELSGKISALENTIQNYDELQDTVEFVLTDKLSTVGNGQSLTGDLTIAKSTDASGDLVVEGNLVVKGTTKTVSQETLEVADNLIVINSEGTSLLNGNSGLAIKTDSTEAYGIVYNSQTNSVNLGAGVISSEGDFVFTSSANNPILTRDDDSKLTDRHLLIWDSVNKKAIDGGPVSNAGNGSNIDSAVLTEINTQVQSNNAKIANVQTDVTNLTSKLNTKLDIQPINSDGTSQLNTVSNTVVGAINESKNTIDGHIARTDNPHSVTIEQIGAEKAFIKNSAFNKHFADEAPLMNSSTGDGGSSIQVSRSDHVHPTDTSRAPVSHADILGTYGVGSVIEYGHVKVDNSISSTSTNPVQNRVVKTYIDTTIEEKLSKTNTQNIVYGTNASGEQIDIPYSPTAEASTVVMRDANGHIYVNGEPTTQYHAASKLYVDNEIDTLTTALNESIANEVRTLNTSIGTQANTFNNEIIRIEGLNTQTNTALNDETTKRKDADTALATQLSTQITNEYNSLKASYDPIKDFIVQLLRLDNSKRYVASWKIVNEVATPYWIELDEGELN